MVETLLKYKAIILGVWVISLFSIELWRPFVKNLSPFTGRRLKNIALVVINALMSPLIIIPITAFASGYILDWRPDIIPDSLKLVADVILLDIYLYWWHRANHEIQFLWRFHSVHHLDETLDFTSALRFHFGEVFLSCLARSTFVVLMGVSLTAVIVFETFVMLSALFHHSNLELSDKWDKLLKRIIVTPSIHWIHHHKVRKDTDSNYATILSVWDKLFGSYNRECEFKPSMAIGVEGLDDKPLQELLVVPLRRPGESLPTVKTRVLEDE